MPKLKTHKGTAKIVKKTGSGKLMHRRPFGNHLRSKKSTYRMRGFAQDYEITRKSDTNVKRQLGEG